MNKDGMINEAINNIIKETKCFNCIHAPICFAQKGGVGLQLASGMGCPYYQAKIADDEAVIKKSEYVIIPKQDWEDRAYIHAMDNHLCQKCRDMIGEKFVTKEENEYWKSRCKEIGDVASKETVKEILTTIYNRLRYATFQQTVALKIVKDLATELGIKLED